jgi:enoyl-CoA hydratase/carnithine racemase
MNSSTAVIDREDQAMILRRDAEGIVTLTLNRPQAYNALSNELMTTLQDELDTIAEDRSLRVVIIEGAGRGFCAGHDMKQLRAHDGELAYFKKTFKQSSRIMMTILRMPQPVIAKVHGIATAAGCQLMATCDLAVASADAHFGTPGVNIGLFCSTPMVALSRDVGRKKTMEMLLTGEMIDAAEAERLGLVNRVVPAEALDEATLELARSVASKSSHVVKIGKEAFYRQLEMGVEEAYAHAAEVMAENMLARDAAEGIDAFLGKRKPTWSDS